MARRECGKLNTPAGEEHIIDDEERANVLLGKSLECCVDVALGAGIQHVNLLSKRMCRLLHVSYRRVGIRAGWVCEDADDGRLGHHLVQQPESLGIKFPANVSHARRVATWMREAGDEG